MGMRRGRKKILLFSRPQKHCAINQIYTSCKEAFKAHKLTQLKAAVGAMPLQNMDTKAVRGILFMA